MKNTASNYEVILTENAKNELEEIYEYISKLLVAEIAAKKFISNFQNKILRLKFLPYSCSKIRYKKDMLNTYRKLIINNFIAIYRVDELNKKVYIIRIIYCKSNYY